jgi:acyl carrier protein
MDVEREIREFVVQNFLYGDESAAIPENDSFIDRGIIDSTGVLEIVNFLETRFGITLRDDELIQANLDSIGNIVRFVRSKLPGGMDGA